MTAYDRLARNLEREDASGRSLMLQLACASDGLSALAVFCACERYSREDAAAAIGCEPEALFYHILALTQTTSTVEVSRCRPAGS